MVNSVNQQNTAIGYFLSGISNSSFNNLTVTNFLTKGIWVINGDNISFNNGVITNSDYGIYLNPLNSGQIFQNVSFTGNYDLRLCDSPIGLTDNNNPSSIFNTSFNGKIKTRSTISPAITIDGRVYGTSITGLNDSSGTGIVILGNFAQGTVIRNSSFNDPAAITLVNNPFNVDARYNDFPWQPVLWISILLFTMDL